MASLPKSNQPQLTQLAASYLQAPGAKGKPETQLVTGGVLNISAGTGTQRAVFQMGVKGPIPL